MSDVVYTIQANHWHDRMAHTISTYFKRLHFIVGFTSNAHLHTDPVVINATYYVAHNKSNGLFVMALLTTDSRLKVKGVIRRLFQQCSDTSIVMGYTYATDSMGALEAMYYAMECEYRFVPRLQTSASISPYPLSVWRIECIRMIQRCESIGEHVAARPSQAKLIHEQLKGILKVGYPHFQGLSYKMMTARFNSVGFALYARFTLTGQIHLAKVFEALADTPVRSMVWADLSSHSSCACVQIGFEFVAQAVPFRVWTNLMRSGIASVVSMPLIYRTTAKGLTALAGLMHMPKYFDHGVSPIVSGPLGVAFRQLYPADEPPVADQCPVWYTNAFEVPPGEMPTEPEMPPVYEPPEAVYAPTEPEMPPVYETPEAVYAPTEPETPLVSPRTFEMARELTKLADVCRRRQLPSLIDCGVDRMSVAFLAPPRSPELEPASVFERPPLLTASLASAFGRPPLLAASLASAFEPVGCKRAFKPMGPRADRPSKLRALALPEVSVPELSLGSPVIPTVSDVLARLPGFSLVDA